MCEGNDQSCCASSSSFLTVTGASCFLEMHQVNSGPFFKMLTWHWAPGQSHLAPSTGVKCQSRQQMTLRGQRLHLGPGSDGCRGDNVRFSSCPTPWFFRNIWASLESADTSFFTLKEQQSECVCFPRFLIILNKPVLTRTCFFPFTCWMTTLLREIIQP